MNVIVVNSGVGNIPNAMRGLERAGALVTLSDDPAVIAAAERLVLPGVGAFPAAMGRLIDLGLDHGIRHACGRGVPILGICLGHQLLFETSSEHGVTKGLGLLSGRVTELPAGIRKPHMGWSQLLCARNDRLLGGLENDAWMYFVHSYAAEADPANVVAWVDCDGTKVCAAVRHGNVCGAQFHPEKSGAAGARFLANFMELTP